MYDSSKQGKSADMLLLGMYHRKTLDKHKERVLADLTKPKGSCKVVVATTSLAMGVDIPDLRCIIHYGCPLDVEDYIQGIGKGRQGQETRGSFASILRSSGCKGFPRDEIVIVYQVS